MPHKQTDYFRQNLGTICAEHGEIQRLADRAGMTRAYISNIIRGKATPSLEFAARIADAANVSLQDLLATPEQFAKKLHAVA